MKGSNAMTDARPGRWIALVALVALTAAATPVAAADAGPTTLAVLNFTNRNPGDGWDWLEKGKRPTRALRLE